jgi:hypothetical protein
MLLFYVENQEVFHWAVPAVAAEEDPPVWQSVDDALDQWTEDHDRLSQFFVTMLFHHRVRMQPCVFARVPRSALSALPLAPVTLPGRRRPLSTVHRAGPVVVEIEDLNEDDVLRVRAGASDGGSLEAFRRAHPFDWS